MSALAQAKAERRKALRQECLVRVQALYPGVESYGVLELFVGLWTQGLAPAAKSPQGDWAKLIQTVQAARAAALAVRQATTVEDVAAVVPAWPT